VSISITDFYGLISVAQSAMYTANKPGPSQSTTPTFTSKTTIVLTRNSSAFQLTHRRLLEDSGVPVLLHQYEARITTLCLARHAVGT
jgi:hypothetical protein